MPKKKQVDKKPNKREFLNNKRSGVLAELKNFPYVDPADSVRVERKAELKAKLEAIDDELLKDSEKFD